jgi:predicted dithiol-disulfide oxidoreductase (DUF899 family)
MKTVLKFKNQNIKPADVDFQFHGQWVDTQDLWVITQFKETAHGKTRNEYMVDCKVFDRVIGIFSTLKAAKEAANKEHIRIGGSW